MEKLRQLYFWIDDRLHLTKLFESTAGHHVPKSSGSWFYVFGSATLLYLLFALTDGIVKFHLGKNDRSFVSVLPKE